MKLERQAEILKLIHSYEIDTQEELARRLNDAGYRVTQATVSRDIRDMKLTKVEGENGRLRYVLLQNQPSDTAGRFVRVLKDAVVSLDTAENILVIRTVPGMAMAAAACGADGLIIEVHNDPMHALCDGAQSLRPEDFDALAKKVLCVRDAARM